MNSEIIRIGTRNSKLALWQADLISIELNRAGVETELVPMETKGDKIQNVSIAKIGSKGVFTEELESKLLSGEVDIAVHSAKDMQSDLGPKFQIIAFTERELANDVLVSHKPELELVDDPDLTIGTSSTRRIAMLKRYYPKVQIVDMRGNLQTRISKMAEGRCDAMILAYAGIHRMNQDSLIREKLDLTKFTPAVGQGTIAVEAATSLNPKKTALVRQLINHEPTESTLIAERTFLKVLEGGCSIPVYGNASLASSNIEMTGGIISLDGAKEVRISERMPESKPEILGEVIADRLLSQGGAEILQEIRNSL